MIKIADNNLYFTPRKSSSIKNAPIFLKFCICMKLTKTFKMSTFVGIIFGCQKPNQSFFFWNFLEFLRIFFNSQFLKKEFVTQIWNCLVCKKIAEDCCGSIFIC